MEEPADRRVAVRVPTSLLTPLSTMSQTNRVICVTFETRRVYATAMNEEHTQVIYLPIWEGGDEAGLEDPQGQLRQGPVHVGVQSQNFVTIGKGKAEGTVRFVARPAEGELVGGSSRPWALAIEPDGEEESVWLYRPCKPRPLLMQRLLDDLVGHAFTFSYDALNRSLTTITRSTTNLIMLEVRPEGPPAVRFMAEGKEGDFRVALPLEAEAEAVRPDQLLYRYYLIQGFRTLHTLIKRMPRRTVGRFRWRPAEGILQWLLPTETGHLLTMISPPSEQAILNGGYRRLYRGQRHIIPAMRPRHVDPAIPCEDVVESEEAWRGRVDRSYERCQAEPPPTNITKDQFERNLRQLRAERPPTSSDASTSSSSSSSEEPDKEEPEKEEPDKEEPEKEEPDGEASDKEEREEDDPAFRASLDLLRTAVQNAPTPSPSPSPPPPRPTRRRPRASMLARMQEVGGGADADPPEAPPRKRSILSRMAEGC